jgi:hypothetical protein
MERRRKSGLWHVPGPDEAWRRDRDAGYVITLGVAPAFLNPALHAVEQFANFLTTGCCLSWELR